MIPVDLSVNCESGIYDPNGSGIQILGIRSRDPFSGSTDMSGADYDILWTGDYSLMSLPDSRSSSALKSKHESSDGRADTLVLML